MRHLMIACIVFSLAFSTGCDIVDLEEFGLGADDDSEATDDESEPSEDDEVETAADQRTEEDIDDRYVVDGELKYIPPDGWEPHAGHPGKYGPIAGGAASNINFDSEPSIGDFDSYMEVSIQNLEEAIPGIEIRERREFTAQSGEEALVLETVSAQHGVDFIQRLYFFDPDGPTRFVGACTVTQEHDESVLEECEESIKTVRLL